MTAAGCSECHDTGVRFENDWFNFRDPELSRILRAPLAKGGSGHGAELCREAKVDDFRRLRIFSTGRYEHAVKPLSGFPKQTWRKWDKGFTPEQRRAFTGLLETGIGVVSTHHNHGTHRDWPEFAGIIGGKYVFEPEVIDGKEHGKSNYAHDQDLKVTVVAKEHPITKGLAGFTIHDESYGRFHVAPDSHVLRPGFEGHKTSTRG